MALRGNLDCLIAIIRQQAQQQAVAANFAAEVKGLRIGDAQIELIGNKISVLGNMLQLSAGMGAFGSRQASFLLRSGCGRSCRGHHGPAADLMKPCVPVLRYDPARLPSSAICAQPLKANHAKYRRILRRSCLARPCSKQSTTCSRWAENRRIMGSPLPGPYGFRFHPWCREIQNSTSAMTVAMKAAQLGVTECGVRNRAL